jgi:release factor glutamine methyltransferase
MTDGRSLTWRALWLETAEVLGDANDARWLCQEASGLEGVEWALGLESLATQRGVAHLDHMVQRRLDGEPIQYVLGHWSFRHLDLKVDRRVLVPRPETELVVDVVLELVADRSSRTIADLGTGSGAIGLALASELPLAGTQVWCTDISASALEVARANCAGLGRAGANVRIEQGDWFGALPADMLGELDVVVSNPPYVGSEDPDIDASVLVWEPLLALIAGTDGLDHIAAIIAGARHWLRPDGTLVIEIGHRQGAAVTALGEASGASVKVLQDLAGRDRIAVLRWSY